MTKKVYLGNCVKKWNAGDIATHAEEINFGYGFMLVFETYEDFKKAYPGQEPLGTVEIVVEESDETEKHITVDGEEKS